MKRVSLLVGCAAMLLAIVAGPAIAGTRVTYIGATRTSINHIVDRAPCWRVDILVYVPHVRERYRVEQNGKVAEISVLRSVSGILPVYTAIEPLGYQACDTATFPVNPSATCASMGSTPTVGNDCLAATSSDGRRRYIRDEPVLTGESMRGTSTWGEIKALYSN